MNVKDEFGHRLRTERRKLGLSQVELAKAAHISKKSVDNYENGRCLPRLDAAVLIANALGRSLDHLLGLNDDDEEFYRAILEDD